VSEEIFGFSRSGGCRMEVNRFRTHQRRKAFATTPPRFITASCAK
jgi:hypothetical protein